MTSTYIEHWVVSISQSDTSGMESFTCVSIFDSLVSIVVVRLNMKMSFAHKRHTDTGTLLYVE